MNLGRKSAFEAAKQFVSDYFPVCEVALLAGSVVRMEATATSDLDIVIIDEHAAYSYRESMVVLGWPIEVFVHTATSYSSFFAMDAARGNPTLPRMVVESVIIKDNGTNIIATMRNEAKEIIEQGPPEWSEETIKIKRYTLTDLLDDFVGATIYGEQMCIALELASTLPVFYLRINRQWVGESKWIYRELKRYQPDFADQYLQVLNSFYQDGEKAPLVELVDEVLAPHGGRLFEGFSLGKE